MRRKIIAQWLIVLGFSFYAFIHTNGQTAADSEIQKRRIKAQGAKWDSLAWKIAYKDNLTEDEKIAGLSLFWSEVKYNFAYFDHVPELDWDKLYLEYLPKVRATKSTIEYYQLLQQMCAQLKDGHTNVYFPVALRDEVYARPALRTSLIENRVLITKLMQDDLQKEGIVVGQEVVAIDGIPVQQYARDRVLPYQSASTKQDLEKRVYSYALLAGSKTKPVELTLRDAQGNVFKKSLKRYGMNELKNASSNFEFKMLEGNVAYVALNSFENDSVVKAFDEKFDEIVKSDALVIDIRNNGGGNSDVGYGILAYLTDKPFETSAWATREYRPSYRAWGNNQRWYAEAAEEFDPKKITEGKKLYTKPVVVLTSAGTYSAAEDFSIAFDSLKRGKIIGETTGGSTGQPLFFELPGGGNGRVCTKRDTYPNGKEWVGIGIKPDIAVQPTVNDFRANRDTVLEAALRNLRSGNNLSENKNR